MMALQLGMTYINKQQKEALNDLLSQKPNLVSGRFSSQFTHADAQREWESIALELNAIPGATKTWKQWRKSWQDLRSKTKRMMREQKALEGIQSTPQDMKLLTFAEHTAHDQTPENNEESESFVTIKILEEEDDEPGPSRDPLECDDIQETHIAETPEEKPIPIRRRMQRRPILHRRVEPSVQSNWHLHELAKLKIELKKQYYSEKLTLLRKNVNVNERIAKSLEELSHVLRNKV